MPISRTIKTLTISGTNFLKWTFQGGPSTPAPSPGGLHQLGDGFAEQQQQVDRNFNSSFHYIFLDRHFY